MKSHFVWRPQYVHLSKPKECPQRCLSIHPPSCPSCFYTWSSLIQRWDGMRGIRDIPGGEGHTPCWRYWPGLKLGDSREGQSVSLPRSLRSLKLLYYMYRTCFFPLSALKSLVFGDLSMTSCLILLAPSTNGCSVLKRCLVWIAKRYLYNTH